MRMSTIALAPIAALILLSACAKPITYTQAQLNALETRIVEAGFTDTFNAATGALFDEGYLIMMSDREGGLITGQQVRQTSGFWATAPYSVSQISIQVREDGPHRSRVRVKTATNGLTEIDREAIERIWVLMQRQVLMTELPSDDNVNDDEAVPD